MSAPQFRWERGADETPTVVAVGEIDLANVDDFRAALTGAASEAVAVTVDLTKVDYCDSAAVRALFAVAGSTSLHLLVRSTGPLKSLLNISGLDRVTTVTTVD